MAKQSDDKLWQEFIDSGAANRGISTTDLMSIENPLPALGQTSRKEEMLALKSVLTDDAYKRLAARWRKFKHRSTSDITTLTISRSTLNRLRAVARETGLDQDNYDLLLEILMDPEHKLDEHLVSDNVANIPTSLNISEQSNLLRAKLRFRPRSWQYLVNIAEFAFGSGWLACKHLSGGKRTTKAEEEALSEFMRKLKGLE